MKKPVQIVGAGISGLLCAYFAAENGHQVEVFDTAPQAGGKIHTHQSKHGMMESAANATLADQLVEDVAQKIGLKLIAKKSNARKRFIYTMGAITRWPLGLLDSLRLLRFLFLWKWGAASVKPRAQESLKVWSDRVLSSNISDHLLGPACQGIFGVDTEPLSGTLIYNYFFSKTPRLYGQLRGSVAPEAGMGQWVSALQKYLQAKGVQFYFSQAPQISANKTVIVATDLKNAIKILKEHNDPRASMLAHVPCVDLLSVNVFYKTRPQKQKVGFGVLFAKSQKLEPLGVLFNSDIFENRSPSAHSETWIFGSSKSQYSLQPGEFFLQHIQAVRQKLWQNTDVPLDVRINRWPDAIPLYGVELEKALEQLKQVKTNSNIHLMGNYLGEIGLNRLFHRAKSLLEAIESV